VTRPHEAPHARGCHHGISRLQQRRTRSLRPRCFVLASKPLWIQMDALRYPGSCTAFMATCPSHPKFLVAGFLRISITYKIIRPVLLTAGEETAHGGCSCQLSLPKPLCDISPQATTLNAHTIRDHRLDKGPLSTSSFTVATKHHYPPPTPTPRQCFAPRSPPKLVCLAARWAYSRPAAAHPAPLLPVALAVPPQEG